MFLDVARTALTLLTSTMLTTLLALAASCPGPTFTSPPVDAAPFKSVA